MLKKSNNIGLILKDKGDLAGALEYAKKALTIDEKSQDEVKMALRYNNIGYILQDMKKESEAQEYFKKASEIERYLSRYN
ncbi:MAG: tetratricopeptide repeat protein [Nitrosopumilus sp.]